MANKKRKSKPKVVRTKAGACLLIDKAKQRDSCEIVDHGRGIDSKLPNSSLTNCNRNVF